VPQKLILWDIDGTLLYTGGVAGECMRATMRQVYGRESQGERHQYAGKTDRQIILETFADRNEAELIGLFDLFTTTYLAKLNANRAAFLERGSVLPGVRDVLARLVEHPVIQSALTGNIAAVARLKLELMDLIGFIDLDAGAYGSDHHDRTKLPKIAATRAAQRYGREFRGEDIVVIGDTPFDIACGRAFGTRTIAIASGPFSVADLTAHSPDAVFASLTDTDAVVAAILG
jgi:phosphoglycolate phosphatase-like HAD superfamily hydrolase